MYRHGTLALAPGTHCIARSVFHWICKQEQIIHDSTYLGNEDYSINYRAWSIAEGGLQFPFFHKDKEKHGSEFIRSFGHKIHTFNNTYLGVLDVSPQNFVEG